MHPKQGIRILFVFLLCLLFLIMNGCESDGSGEDKKGELDPELEVRIEGSM